MVTTLPFKTFRTTRMHFQREIEGLTSSELLAIPAGWPDNILWNMGHITCSLSRLTYVFSGFPFPLPERYLQLFGKGTSATEWTGNPDVEEVLGYFHGIPERLESDYEAGKFGTYQPLTIAPGHVIECVEEAVAFHCFHEGLHIGRTIALKEQLGLKAND